jgi:hypothetical protein
MLVVLGRPKKVFRERKGQYFQKIGKLSSLVVAFGLGNSGLLWDRGGKGVKRRGFPGNRPGKYTSIHAWDSRSRTLVTPVPGNEAGNYMKPIQTRKVLRMAVINPSTRPSLQRESTGEIGKDA